jgi:hypothetical protein
MELSPPPLVVAFELSEKRKAIVADALAGASAVVYLTELDETTAMALAAAKRLILEHENLKHGQFNQFTQTRMLAGGLCGIFGLGALLTAPTPPNAVTSKNFSHKAL